MTVIPFVIKLWITTLFSSFFGMLLADLSGWYWGVAVCAIIVSMWMYG